MQLSIGHMLNVKSHRYLVPGDLDIKAGHLLVMTARTRSKRSPAINRTCFS